MTTRAPASASISPSLVTVLTPVLGDAATTSCPFFRNLDTTFEPMRPPPPMTTIFMDDPLHLSIVERLVGENAHLVAGPTLFLGIGRHRHGQMRLVLRRERAGCKGKTITQYMDFHDVRSRRGGTRVVP